MPGKLSVLLLSAFLFACNNHKNVPDVSSIKIDVTIKRFEKAFFQIDTLNTLQGLNKVQQQFPDFYPDFMRGILQVNEADTGIATTGVVKSFLSSYHSFNDSLNQIFSNMNTEEKEIEKGLRFVKYYFPQYKVPGIITFVGPLDAPGVALTNHYIAIGLQQFAGAQFSAYQTAESQQLYPSYISRRFSRDYIAVNCMKIVGEDIFADNSAGQPLIVQMIEKGKRLFLLDHFMPLTADSLKTGFTNKQLKWSEDNEGLIWNHIITNEDLYSVDPVVIQTYIGEAPFTQNMPESSPGNIGEWVGWQIIKKFAENFPDKSLPEIMQTEAQKIMEGAKYKPK